MDVEVNYLAVLLAALATMVIGSLWYLPKTFGNAWMKMTNADMNREFSKADQIYTFGGAFVLSAITAYMLAYLAFISNAFFDNGFLQDTLTVAFVAWLGFTAARLAMHDVFENRRKKLTLINVAHEFVAIMVMALIIGSLGV